MAGADQFYLTLFGTSSQHICGDNRHNAYTVELAQPIELGTNEEEWEVGVCEIRYPPPPAKTEIAVKHCLIYVDIITPQYVGDQLVRCIRTFLHSIIMGNIVFNNVYYVPVEKKRFRTISVEFVTEDGKRLEMPDSAVPSKLVLHFRRSEVPRGVL